MLQTIIEAIVAYAATNIDDLLVSLLFFAQTKSRKEDWQIVFGKYLGIALLTAISVLGAYGLSFLPAKALAWLGLLPAWLGIKELRDKAEDNEAAPAGHDSGPAETGHGLAVFCPERLHRLEGLLLILQEFAIFAINRLHLPKLAKKAGKKIFLRIK